MFINNLIIEIIKFFLLKIKAFLAYIIILLLIIFLYFNYSMNFYLSSLNKYVYKIFTPILEVSNNTIKNFKDYFNVIVNFINIEEKYVKLLADKEYMEEKLVNLKYIEYENKQLRELVSYIPDYSPQFITVRVINSTSGTFYRNLMINAGIKENIREGQVVIYKNSLVGKISEVGTNYSTIMTILDVNFRAPGFSIDLGEKFIVSGNNDYSMKILYAPKEIILNQDMEIFTSGDGKFFPPGILIGRIKMSSVMSKSLIIPSVDFSSLNYVTILQ